jgi:hypothetical protein
MNVKKILIRTGLFIVGIPVVLILTAMIAWYFDERSGRALSGNSLCSRGENKRATKTSS